MGSTKLGVDSEAGGIFLQNKSFTDLKDVDAEERTHKQETGWKMFGWNVNYAYSYVKEGLC